jgi:hypothetical protein
MTPCGLEHLYWQKTRSAWLRQRTSNIFIAYLLKFIIPAAILLCLSPQSSDAREMFQTQLVCMFVNIWITCVCKRRSTRPEDTSLELGVAARRLLHPVALVLSTWQFVRPAVTDPAGIHVVHLAAHKGIDIDDKIHRLMLAHAVVASFWQTQLSPLPWSLELPVQALACALLLRCTTSITLQPHTAWGSQLQALVTSVLTTCCSVVTDIHLGSQTMCQAAGRATARQVPTALIILLVLLLPVYLRWAQRGSATHCGGSLWQTPAAHHLPACVCVTALCHAHM